MKIKDIIIIVLLLALTVLSYKFGYQKGQLQESEAREALARLTINLRLYDVAQEGDLGKIKRDLGMIVLGQTRTFETKFGAPLNGERFAERFTHAQKIAAQVESQLVHFGSSQDFINALGETNATKK